jgi:hypothetical protein
MSWFLVTTAVYYGFGPLLYYLGTTETVNHVDAFYVVGDALLFRCSALVIVGVSVVIVVYLILNKIFASTPSLGVAAVQSLGSRDAKGLWRVAVVFIGAGVSVKMFLVMPAALGVWDVVLPGSIEYFAQLSSLALVPLLILATTSRKKHLALFLLLLGFELGVAFLHLSKLAVVKIALLPVLALVFRGVSFRKLAVAGLLSVLVYSLILVPIVNYGRIEFSAMGLKSPSEAAELIEDFAGGAASDRLSSVMPGVQAWWARLNYAPAQAFALDAYDQGLGGDTFELAKWVFVPRLVYPDKPVTTTGDKFNEMIAGNPNSKSAPGMFAEGYWNAGWLGLIIVASVMGLFYWAWERYTRAFVVSRLQLEYLPVAWLGLFAAILQDSWFVPTTIGVIPFAILFHALASCMSWRQAPARIRAPRPAA